MTEKHLVASNDILIRGDDLIKADPDFRLVGRDVELEELLTILMKMRKRNLIVTGRGGVGISAIVLGIQASKKEYTTPVDIVGKRFFWLNTDMLFESGDHRTINALFEKARQNLCRSKDSVVVVEDTVDFIKAAQNHGSTHLINGLMGDIKAGRYQAILETKDDSLGDILKCDGDILESCTLYEVKEPSPVNLRLIVAETVKTLEKHHGIRVTRSALEAAASLTEKYKIPELRAQPDAAVSLLDQALTDYCRQAHTSPQHIQELKQQLKSEEAKLLQNPSDTELQASRTAIVGKIETAQAAWDQKQKEVRALYRDISDGEDEVRKCEDQIESIRAALVEKAKQIENSKNTDEKATQDTQRLGALSTMMTNVQLDTDEISALKGKIAKIENLVEAATKSYKKNIAEIYSGLAIEESGVLKSFSKLSGIPVDKLNEDDRERLKNLEHVLANRVIGQDEPTSEVAKAVKRARLGLKMPNKPSGTFMFLGPSGVGKTELAKSLAESLQVPLLRFDMSEYMEKHAIAKLIGAPPGYEGYEHGGVLTNAVRKNPYSVVLFDEIEKAHVDVFNLMLQLLDDARLTDSRGLTASFKDTIIILTTNIGTTHFLDEKLDFEQAKELALADLRAQYRPEFLGRFGGNIYCFQRLQLAVLKSIAAKDLVRINSLIADRNISLEMPDDELSAMIRDKYMVREGARSILGYIDRNITSGIADVILSSSYQHGKILLSFDTAKGKVIFTPVQ